MLKAGNRLKTRKDFDRVFRKGRAFSGPLMLVRVAANGLAVSRIGFAVGTKIDKRAVVRNRLRRRLREIFRRELLPEMTKGFDLVVIAKPGSTKVEFVALRQAALQLMTQTGLLRVRK